MEERHSFKRGDIVKSKTRNKYSITDYDVECYVVESTKYRLWVLACYEYPKDKWDKIEKRDKRVYDVNPDDFVFVRSTLNNFSRIKEIIGVTQ